MRVHFRITLMVVGLNSKVIIMRITLHTLSDSTYKVGEGEWYYNA